MEKLNDAEYELTFSYEDDAHLDKQICDLLRELDQEADMRHCFIEVDIREKGADLSW